MPLDPSSIGAEEFGYFYTRGDCIVIPRSAFNERLAGGGMANLAAFMLQETFHVYSRLNPDKRAFLYQRIGFSRLDPLELGGFLAGRRMTNPDGVDRSYVIKARNDWGEDAWIIPVVFWDGKLTPGSSSWSSGTAGGELLGETNSPRP